MFEKESETKLSEEDYKLAEETIKPIYRNAIKNDYSFAKYGVECYLTGYNKANEWHFVKDKLPPMDEVVYLWHENESFPVCAYRHIPYGKTEKDWLWECYWGSGYTVTQSVAKDYWWKEIVLPKEIK